MIGIVSTFSDKGYHEYAHLFVNSLENFLDKEIQVFLYVDNIKFKTDSNIKRIPLEKSIPKLVDFKTRNRERPFDNYRQDGVRFSHKSYAIWHAATSINVEKYQSYKLFWLDADTIIQRSLDSKYLEKFLPKGKFTCYLGRPGRFTETGFLGFDLKHPAKNRFFSDFIDYYNSDRIYSELPFYTDCHVYDATREKFVNTGEIQALDLTPGLGKSNFNFIHKGYMIHNKGTNKTVKGKKEKN